MTSQQSDQCAQPQDILSEVVKWATTGFRPDIVIVDHGPHSAFKRLPADNFAASMRDIAAVFGTWRNSPVRCPAAHQHSNTCECTFALANTFSARQCMMYVDAALLLGDSLQRFDWCA